MVLSQLVLQSLEDMLEKMRLREEYADKPEGKTS